MLVIKRDGREVQFSKEKIIDAIQKASDEISDTHPDSVISRIMITAIATEIANNYSKTSDAINVEQIQDDIEMGLMKRGYYDVARAYVRYRYKRQTERGLSDLDKKILAIVNGESETSKQENANKNPAIASTQRDYIAGEVNRDLTNRYLLPKDIREAHEDGIIHFHDSDYALGHIFNCCLVNMEDILQNGTVISGTLIEKPHSFSKACNIATQVISTVASNQYGGQSVSLSHLAPFVDESRKKIRQDLRDELAVMGYRVDDIDDSDFEKAVNERLKKEIKNGVQTIQYQINTLMTTNGQTPFVTLFMYIDEVPEGQIRDDLVMIIEEVLRQRIEGVKNEKGVWITPAFPKLIYVLDEDNVEPGSRYYETTVLAAKCTAKRMVPDYISAKKMMEYKVDKNNEGHVYTCINIPVPSVSDDTRKLA